MVRLSAIADASQAGDADRQRKQVSKQELRPIQLRGEYQRAAEFYADSTGR